MVGDLIRETRQKHGLTLFALAVKVGVSPSAIYYWEVGRVQPRAGNLRRLEKALGFEAGGLASRYISASEEA